MVAVDMKLRQRSRKAVASDARWASALTAIVAALLIPGGGTRRTLAQFGDGNSASSGTDGASNGCDILINEVVRKDADGGPDWIELKDCTGSERQLSGWRLVDNSGDEFALGSNGCTHTLPANGYLVLERDAECSFTFGIGKEEKLQLLSADGTQVDSVSILDGAAPEGLSYARVPDGSSTWVSATPTKGVSNPVELTRPDRVASAPEDVTVVINEVSPTQKAGDQGAQDWVELYNYGTAPVDLTGLQLSDSNTDMDVRFVFGGQGCSDTVIQPGQYLVLYGDSACSFRFGFGASDETILWWDESTKIDSTRFGSDNGLPLIPSRVTWCRLPDVSGPFEACWASQGSANGEAVPNDQLVQLVQEDQAAQAANNN